MVRRRPAKPLFSSSNLEAASIINTRGVRFSVCPFFSFRQILSLNRSDLQTIYTLFTHLFKIPKQRRGITHDNHCTLSEMQVWS